MFFEALIDPTVVDLVERFAHIQKQEVSRRALLDLVVVKVSHIFDVSIAGAPPEEADLGVTNHFIKRRLESICSSTGYDSVIGVGDGERASIRD